MKRALFRSRFNPSPSCRFTKDTETKQGLSYTPAELMDYAKKGIPVSASNSESYFDGTANPSFDMPVDQLRGVDVVDCWVAQNDSRSRLARAHVNDVGIYG